MGYKTIVTYLAVPDSVPDVMNTVLPIAEKFDAHLTGTHVFAGVPLVGTIGAQVPPEIIDQYADMMREDAQAIKKAFTEAVKGCGVQTEWRDQEEKSVHLDLLGAILEQTRCADLLVMAQTESEQRVGDLVTDIIMDSGRPVLIIPKGGNFGDLSGKAVVGWDGSREATRAVFDALPLLKRAKTVDLVTVGKSSDAKDAVRAGGGEMASILSRHDVNAELATVDRGDAAAGDALLKYASEKDGDLLVMGCYGHSRLRERLFGGATQHVMKNMIVPVLMSH